jgi:hypothetical protein
MKYVSKPFEVDVFAVSEIVDMIINDSQDMPSSLRTLVKSGRIYVDEKDGVTLEFFKNELGIRWSWSRNYGVEDSRLIAIREDGNLFEISSVDLLQYYNPKF